MVHCDSNQRCEACPVERLPNAGDRIKAGGIVRTVVRILSSAGDIATTRISVMRGVTEERAAFMDAEELTAPIIGAVAINLADECKVD